MPTTRRPSAKRACEGCNRLKAYVGDAGRVDLGGIDYRGVPAGCSDDASIDDAGLAPATDGTAGSQDTAAEAPTAESAASERPVEAGREPAVEAMDGTPPDAMADPTATDLPAPQGSSRAHGAGCSLTRGAKTTFPVAWLGPLLVVGLLRRRARLA